MAIRYDDAERTLTCSVRDLVVQGAPQGHLTLEVVQRRAARAAVGRQIHLDWQLDQSAKNEAYRAEVSLKRQVAVDAWTCVVQGRVDGLAEEDGHTVVEEVKSTVLDAARLYGTTAEEWPAFVAQLEIYLWMLAESGYARPVGRLVLVSVADGATHVLGVALQQAQVAQVVKERLQELVDARERRIAWLAGRRSRTVEAPFATWRPGQREIVEATQWGLDAGLSVLVEAPTGLGKTAAALTGALRHALAHDKQVFWATARTTQQQGAMRALRAMSEVGVPLRSVTIRAKHKVCLNDEVSCRPDACRFAEGYYDKLRATAMIDRLADREEHLGSDLLEALALQHVVCPFEVALDVSGQLDVVVGDYNYVFDPSVHLRRHFGEDAAGGWVVVVDEVHQLPERVRGYFSPRVELAVVREAAAQLWSAGPRFAVFTSLTQRIEAALVDAIDGAKGRSSGDEQVFEPDAERWESLAEAVDAVGLDYALLKADGAISWQTTDDAWLTLARQVLRFASGLASVGDAVVPVARRGEARSVGLVCLDPSPQLGSQIASLGGFVGLSATLRPHDFFARQLGLTTEQVDVVSVASPFPPERRRVLVAPRISTAYADRERHAPATAALAQACIEAVPGNVAVYFPSFAMLEDVAERWQLTGRRVLLQARDMDDAARSRFLEALADDGESVVLAAVLGGIYAEGIDLPPGALSAVVVVGPALPPVGLSRDLLREHYELTHGSGFFYASLVPGITRVVQAAGRLIRRPEDRGVVLLVGRRFRWREVQQLLPEGFAAEVADDPPGSVAAFFAEGAATE
ncbi:MAG: hypothetical protein KTR31_08085 [Myxococcales bacterium]|nr:hypothetical protein [Myxococcales bacterium]